MIKESKFLWPYQELWQSLFNNLYRLMLLKYGKN